MNDKIRFSPMPGQVLMHIDSFGDYQAGDPATKPHMVRNIEDANLITSTIATEYPPTHKVVIDLDHAAQLIPSSTPGHFHLYIDHDIEWSLYAELLEVLAKVGLLEKGYVSASLERKFTAVRLPWVRKTVAERLDDLNPYPVSVDSSTGGWAHDEGPRNF
jgi:hypothetical protein